MIAKELRALIVDAMLQAMVAGEIPEIPEADIPDFVLERPRHKTHGDWATNLALVLSGKMARPPREIASVVAQRLTGGTERVESEIPTLAEIEVAGPGFINFTLNRDRILSELGRIAKRGGRLRPVGFRQGPSCSRRVRLRQPRRPAARRARSMGGLGRCPVQPARGHGT